MIVAALSVITSNDNQNANNRKKDTDEINVFKVNGYYHDKINVFSSK